MWHFEETVGAAVGFHWLENATQIDFVVYFYYCLLQHLELLSMITSNSFFFRMFQWDSVITMSNLSVDNITEWLHQQMGPPHLPLATAVPLTIIFVVIFISGLLGNIAVCLVITRHRAMHTATNYYLFNLAISDLILLIFGEWIKILFDGNFLCNHYSFKDSQHFWLWKILTKVDGQ